LNFSTAEPGTAAFNGNSDCELVLRAICVFDANGLLQVEGRFIIPLISRKNKVICINVAFCAPFNFDARSNRLYHTRNFSKCLPLR
jgi:hypothetical protein